MGRHGEDSPFSFDDTQERIASPKRPGAIN